MTGPFISYAQNFEDVRLWRAFSDIVNGRYLDIGTQDPVRDSVSLAFYERCWRGVHVEPTPSYAAAMRAARPDETVIEAAVSSAPGPIQFFEIPETGISTGVAEIAQHHAKAGWEHRILTVPTVTLSSLFDLMGEGTIHWLKIDVEGMEADVLASWGDHPARPAALVIEATAPNTQIPTHDAWHELVLSRGYRDVLFDGLSRYFIHESHAERGTALALSPNVFDGFHVTSTHFVVGTMMAEREAAIATARQQAEAEQQEAIAAAQAQAADAFQAVRVELQASIVAGEKAVAEAQQAIVAQQQQNLALAREAGRLQGELAAQAEAVAARLRDAEAVRRDLAERLAAVEARASQLAGELATTAQRLAESDVGRAQAELQRDEAMKNGEARAAALGADIEQLRAQITLREGQLVQAIRLLGQVPDPLGGWPRRVASVLARMTGHKPAAVLAAHAEQVDAWRAEVAIPAGPGPDWTQFRIGETTAFQDLGQVQRGLGMFPDEGPITSVPRLLAPHDAEFIRVAYEAVLGRAPDPEGGAYYLGRLRAGAHKLEILKQLRRSPEGRDFIPGVAGLDRAIRRHRRANLPVLGPIIRLLTGAEGNSATQRKLRVIANEIGGLRAEQASLFASLHVQTAGLGSTTPTVDPQSPRQLGIAAEDGANLNSGSAPLDLDSRERRLLATLRLHAHTRGAGS